MKISTALEHGVNNGLTYTECAKAMKDAGFQGIDLSLCKHQMDKANFITDEWTRDVIEQADAVKAAGLEIAQCHLPYYPGHLDNPGNGTVEELIDLLVPQYEHALKAAKEVGAEICVVHPVCYLESREKTIDANVRIYNEIIGTIEHNGQQLAVENCFARRHSQYVTAFIEQKETIMEIIDRVGSQNIGACIDTGHANIFRYDICEMARFYGKKLFALHVNSNAGHDEHAIPYNIAGWCERMDFFGFTKALNKIGFTGFYNLEITGGKFPKEVAPLFYAYAAGVAKYLADYEG